MNKTERIGSKNAGFTILAVAEFNIFGVAFGERVIDDKVDYVTWIYRASSPTDYFWGHYISNFNKAREDFLKRVADEADENFCNIDLH